MLDLLKSPFIFENQYTTIKIYPDKVAIEKYVYGIDPSYYENILRGIDAILRDIDDSTRLDRETFLRRYHISQSGQISFYIDEDKNINFYTPKGQIRICSSSFYLVKPALNTIKSYIRQLIMLRGNDVIMYVNEEYVMDNVNRYDLKGMDFEELWDSVYDMIEDLKQKGIMIIGSKIENDTFIFTCKYNSKIYNVCRDIRKILTVQ